MESPGLVTSLIIGMAFIVVGWLIWRKKKLDLIAGYHEDTYQGDKEKLARRIGIVAIAIGVITSIFPISLLILGDISFGFYFFLIAGGLIAAFSNYYKNH